MFQLRQIVRFAAGAVIVVAVGSGCNITLPSLDGLIDGIDPSSIVDGEDGVDFTSTSGFDDAFDGTTLGFDDMFDIDTSGFDFGFDGVFDETTTGSVKLFDQMWETFDENYSYMDYKGVDWYDVRNRHRAKFSSDLSGDEFVDLAVEMLRELSDWHVELMRPDGTWVGTDPQLVELNYPSMPRNRYLADGETYQALGDGVIRHAWLADSIGYIRIDTFAGGAFDDISDEQIENIFARYADAAGMIVDVRPNNGGNESIAARFASHFAFAPVVYGYTETRDGPNHDDFGPMEAKSLEPAERNLFTGPVACLIGQRCLSSAEWFTLMMRACPNVALFGDVTRGGSGFPREFELANGVHYTVSRWIAYTDELVGIEDIGIEPDYWIAPGESVDGAHDYVIESAIAQLRV